MRLVERRPLLAAAVATTVAAATGLLVQGTARAAAGCQVDYSISSQWQGGFGANVNVTNLGSGCSTPGPPTA